MAWPDFFIMGAPKAGTTALHAALSAHPELFLSRIKEPKYFLCDDAPPPRSAHRGPGDAHSRREWVWRRDEYLRLFDEAPVGTLRGESTPFYLASHAAQTRIRESVPEARLIAVLRDPVDRAYSNWMHLRSDGLEPEPDFLAALAAEPARAAAGWAPFWHYRGLGMYGAQLAQLLELFPRDQVHVLRYRELVDTPAEALAAVCDFLGVSAPPPWTPSAENTKPFVPVGTRNDALRRLVRVGASLGQWAPPQAWRRVSAPLIRRLHAGGSHRPPLTRSDRRHAITLFADDIARLEGLLGQSFPTWLDDAGGGAFAARRADAQER